MRVADFSFDLPDELIARFPKADRTSSRLLSLDGPSGTVEHKIFSDILELVNENDLLVFNNTKVIPARRQRKLKRNRHKPCKIIKCCPVLHPKGSIWNRLRSAKNRRPQPTRLLPISALKMRPIAWVMHAEY